jgi:hypothetical protein
MREHRRGIVVTLLVVGAIALAVVVVKVLDAVGDPAPHAGGLPVSAILPRLRGHTDLGPYDGMLFVFQGPTDTHFTMSGVTVPLQIGWYGSDGSRSSGTLMKPCPEKAETECPVYRANGDYEYAVETLEGRLPSGPVTACSPS